MWGFTSTPPTRITSSFLPSEMDPLQHEPKEAPKRKQRSRTKTARLNINEETEKITGCTKTREL